MGNTSAVSIYRKLLSKPLYYFTVALITSFLFLTFDPIFGTLFLGFIIISGLVYLFSISGTIPKLRVDINTISTNSGKAFFYGFIALVIFFILSVGVVRLLQPASFVGVQSVIDRLVQTSLGATPILQGNPYAILFVGGILIPIVETELFFVTLPQVFSSVFNTPLALGSLNTWVLMAAVIGIFTLYHIQAKGITDNVSWVLTYMFGIFQAWLVLKFREGESAIYMHIHNNFLGIAQRLFLKTAVGV